LTKCYDENSIEVLEDLEHIRKRPGMYIGTVDHTGIFQLLKECVDNSVDEYLAGRYATYIQVIIDTGNQIFQVSDNGRGIPLGKHPKTGISTLTTVLTNLQAGGKFDQQTYAISAGLHGVGLKATNALSEWLLAHVWKKNKCYVQSFSRGQYTKKPIRDPDYDNQQWSTQIAFHPDSLIFKNHRLDVSSVRKWLQETSHLCPGLKIELVVDGNSEIFVSGGLGQLVMEQASSNNVKLSHDPIVYISEDNTIQLSLVWALQDEDIVGTGWWSFVNASSTREHGTHVIGVKNAIAESLKTYTKTKLDLRDIMDGLYAAVHVLVKEPQFASQTKDSLLNSDITDIVYNAVFPFLRAYFDSNKAIATQIVERAIQLKEARESYKRKRNAINKVTIKKGARGLLPDKLSEAPFCKAEDRELFIVEGDSAGGGARKARNADFQEVLPLRGKIPNSARWSVEKLLDNKEIAAMITAIGAKITGDNESNDLRKMRVGKVMLLMDADFDGDHIVSLVLTFFAVWLPELIEQGMIYVVDSPLFVGLYKDNRYFGHTLKDLSQKAGVDTSKMQVSRLKGHGESAWAELKEYAMDPETRKLWKVEYTEDDHDIILSLMGAESEARKVLLGI